MARAAFCSQCDANVYVTDDGESFESTWVNDIGANPSRWNETDYTEF